MKTLVIIAAIILLVCVGLVTSSQSPKLICPVCEEEIRDKTFTCGYYVGGKIETAHFKCGLKHHLRTYAKK